ncbi:fragment of putative ATP-dependent protease, Mg chelatase-related protein (part 2), partial [Nitrospina gracilis 3/211]
VKRALEIAAAGGHNIILIGPPGSGKSMLAKRLPTILPPLTLDEAIETTKIHSVLGLMNNGKGLIATRPFRSPHHTISDAGLIGGGKVPMPGEVSLAHNGVLFLDELPEFKRNALEVLRQPMEDRQVCISRASGSLTFPTGFMLVAAMNPCPCGYRTDPKRECQCTPPQIKKYVSRISGPMMDRIDIHIQVPAVEYKDLASNTVGEPSSVLRQRVQKARVRQLQRFSSAKIFSNASMSSKQIKTHCPLDAASQKIMSTAIDKMGMSARAHDRILKVARTIADLAGDNAVAAEHIAEAIQYRTLDREGG